jgi:uncharacterized protein YoxC
MENKEKRETVQYGVETTYEETDSIMGNAREFVTKVKLLLEGIDEDFINIVVDEIKQLSHSLKDL